MHSESSLRVPGNKLPERLDALPWSPWHLRFTIALGVAWLLDGLEGSLAGSLAGALQSSSGLHFTEADLGLSSTIYLAGAVSGALIFGFLADRFGRKRLFLVTLILYLSFTTLTAASWNLFTFTLCRFFTGAGIGGEYAAINSAIDELIPARLRGQVNLAINGTFWLGIMLGSVASSLLLSLRVFGPSVGWRLAFVLGLPIGLLVLFLRRSIPESPRWLIAHGRNDEATDVVQQLESNGIALLRASPPDSVFSGPSSSLRESNTTTHLVSMLLQHRRRSLICLVLMIAQAFLYNSVFFSLTLVLLRYDHVPPERVGYAFLPIALANFAGPFLFGRAIDRIGRRFVIGGSYAIAGTLLLLQGFLLLLPRFGIGMHLAGWIVLFIFASTAASSAYLTVSELFPQEVRALAIAIFYAFGTLLGGVSGPLIFGRIVGSGSRYALFEGYAAGACLMLLAGAIQAIWGVRAERRSLESLRDF